MASPAWGVLTQLPLQTADGGDSSDPFESISNFFESSTWGLVSLMLQVFVVLLWLALVWWTYQDARRRITSPGLVAGAVALSVVLPFLGTIIYLIVRPPEYLLEARERELELIALEHRLAEMGDAEGQAIVGRLLGREGASSSASAQAQLRQAGVATRDELRELETRLTELEYRLRRGVGPATGMRTEPERARTTRPADPYTEAPPRRPAEDAATADDTGRTMIRRLRRTVRTDPEATVE